MQVRALAAAAGLTAVAAFAIWWPAAVGADTYVVEPGAFQVWVGGSSLADLGGTLEVTEGLRLPPQ